VGSSLRGLLITSSIRPSGRWPEYHAQTDESLWVVGRPRGRKGFECSHQPSIRRRNFCFL